MASFTGTNADETITPPLVSPTVTSVPAGAFPSAAADTLDGADGNDILDGGGGNDTLDGGDGNDILDGNDDNDTLDGGRGDDRLVGGAGSDLFIFTSGGDDTIADFDATGGGSGQDYIGVESMNNFKIRDDGDDVVIRFDNGDTLTLLDVKHTVVTDADFQLV